MQILEDRLYTPKELDDLKLLSQVKQWQLRRDGKLGFYQIGRKILYSQKNHIEPYLKSCESKLLTKKG